MNATRAHDYREAKTGRKGSLLPKLIAPQSGGTTSFASGIDFTFSQVVNGAGTKKDASVAGRLCPPSSGIRSPRSSIPVSFGLLLQHHLLWTTPGILQRPLWIHFLPVNVSSEDSQHSQHSTCHTKANSPEQ